MHRSLLALSFFALAVFTSGCMVTTTMPRRVTVEPPPGYVYSYADGSCWADGYWHQWCPWRPGPSFGYYVYDGSFFIYQPHYVWGYRRGYPPPPQWRHHWRPAPPSYRHPPPHRHPHRPPPRRR